MPIVKTAELTGEALNWAVGKADGLALQIQPPQYGIGARVFVESPSGLARYRPTVDWGQCGPLIEKFKVWVSPPVGEGMDEDGWDATIYEDGFKVSQVWGAPDARTAICRAVVAAVSGEAVDVPGELV